MAELFPRLSDDRKQAAHSIHNPRRHFAHWIPNSSKHRIADLATGQVITEECSESILRVIFFPSPAGMTLAIQGYGDAYSQTQIGSWG